MSPTSIDELARQAGQAVREHADRFDLHKPDADRLRRRDRRRRVTTAGAAVAVLVAALVVFVQARPASVPVIGNDGPEATPQQPSDADTPQAITSRILITEGVYEGSDRNWQLHAWLTADEGVCLELRGTGCGRPASDIDPLGSVGSSSGGVPDESGCQYGTVDDQVATVEIEFFGGRTMTVAPVDGAPLSTDFFATCWEGHRRALHVRALDADGDVLDATNIEPNVATSDGPPVVPDSAWFGPGVVSSEISEDVIQVLPGPEHCNWEQALMLHVGWPLGSEKTGQHFRQYVRDPHGVLPTERKLVDYGADADLPDSAEYTGYHTDGVELWIDPSTADELIYIVTADHVEQWPRTQPPLLCY